MEFSYEQLQKIAAWTSIDPTFEADVVFSSILRRVEQDGDYTYRVVADAGYGNYGAFVICRNADLAQEPPLTYLRVSAVAVYLSLLARVGVIARISASYGTTFCGVETVNLQHLLDPEMPGDDLEEYVIDLVQAFGYELLSPDEASEPLPEGIEQTEFCPGPGPWDRLFHLLFALTD